MLDFKIDIKNEQADMDISIELDNVALSGGVYMFLIDEVPLYIGETNIFLSRLAVHLYELKNNSSYFGLGNLEGKHKITYIILNDKLPFEPDLKRKEKENLKKIPDKNRKKREQIQNSFIEKYKPMTQKPIFYDAYKLSKLKGNKKDAMIKDENVKNKIIKDGLIHYKTDYNCIIEEIKKEHLGLVLEGRNDAK